MTTNFITRTSPHIAAALFTLVLGLAATSVFAQIQAGHKEKNREFCSQENSWSEKAASRRVNCAKRP